MTALARERIRFPDEILGLLPFYLADIEDYLALTSVDRRFRHIIAASTSPLTLLRLSAYTGRSFFRPHPLYLVTAVSRSLGSWAAQTPANLRALVTSFWSGEGAVLDLALTRAAGGAVARDASWSIAKIRELWEWRMRVVNPITDLIDKNVGKQWYSKEDFWDTTADAVTLCSDPDETFFRLVMYGEMFGRGWEQWMNDVETGQNDPTVHPSSSIPTRLEFLKYLVPDWHARPGRVLGQRCPPDITSTRTLRAGEYSYFDAPQPIPSPPPTPPYSESDDSGDDEHAAPATAPFVPQIPARKPLIHPFLAIQKETGPHKQMETDLEFCVVIHHLISMSPHWGRIAKRVRESCGGDFQPPTSLRHWEDVRDKGTDWRQKLWENALWMLGNGGMELMADEWAAARREDAAAQGVGSAASAACAGAAGVEADAQPSEQNRATFGEVSAQNEVNKDKLRRWRGIIADMKEEPDRIKFGPRVWTYEVPFLLGDLELIPRRP